MTNEEFDKQRARCHQARELHNMMREVDDFIAALKAITEGPIALQLCGRRIECDVQDVGELLIVQLTAKRERLKKAFDEL